MPEPVDRRDLLVEIGTEELPPKALAELSRSLQENLLHGLAGADLSPTGSRRYATPRRLAVLAEGVPVRQPERRITRRGPALSAAFDAHGAPTPAARGFARSCGVEVPDLQTLETEKGAWLGHIRVEAGAATAALLPGILETAMAALPVPKRMRWGDSEHEFVRPVHWVVLLLGEEIVPATVMGIPAGRETRGHRFHHPATLTVPAPAAYAPLLETEGRVMVNLEARRAAIRDLAEAAAATVGGQARIDESLLDEVAALVEWPVAVVGSFDRRFLEVPPEPLVTTMQDNQKYFPVVDAEGGLLPHFVTISNIDSQDPAQVRAGNERVIRPRFSDAEFFWNQDRRTPLATRIDGLRHVVFQQRLGSLHDKSARMAIVARLIAQTAGGNVEWAERAAWLSKCDLLSEMVQEFPELQGTMGSYYARHDGEAEEVARAQAEHYLPRFAGDAIPSTPTARAVGLADRLDTLVGIFGIGQAPSGNRDPFALRRAALGVIRTLIEGEMDLDLELLLEHTARQFHPDIKAADAVGPVFDFVMERLRGYYQDQGIGSDAFEAVLTCRPCRPLDFHRRANAVSAFRRLPEAASLAAANKRIANLLRQVEGTLPFQLDATLLVEPAEQALARTLEALAAGTVPLLERGRYEEALGELAALRDPVDGFFDTVMVLVDDPRLRANRLALLNELRSLFLRVADFSRLQD